MGAETLVCWRHPERGLVSPAEFVGLAEETGLILPTGRRFLLEACRQAGAWREARSPDAPLLLSVNVSAKQLHRPDLVDDVAGILAETGLEPLNLLKINEATMIELARSLGIKVIAEGVETAGQLAQLTELGCDLAQGSYISKPLSADEVESFLVGPTA